MLCTCVGYLLLVCCIAVVHKSGQVLYIYYTETRDVRTHSSGDPNSGKVHKYCPRKTRRFPSDYRRPPEQPAHRMSGDTSTR